ncbi:Exocyst complex component 2 [Homalodisca vitripennis]|nr:Exocyst complex component 2 [Homalodisca vitripennis]
MVIETILGNLSGKTPSLIPVWDAINVHYNYITQQMTLCIVSGGIAIGGFGVRNLVHVDCEGDPVWDAINVHYNYITQLTLNLVHVDCEGDPVWDAINVHYNYITQLTLCIVTLVWTVIAGTWYTWTVRGTQNLVHVDCEGDPVWDAINVHYNYITQLTLCIVTLVWNVIAGTWYTWTVRGTQNLVHVDCEGDPVWDAINVHYNYITQMTLNLVHVDCEGDPVWDAINVHYNYITQQLTLCKEKHLAAETSSEESGKTPKSSRHSKTPSGSQIYDSQDSVPHRIHCVEQLTEIMHIYLSDLWKLGQAYFCGELQVRPQPGRPQEFKKIVMSVISMMCGYLRGAILPHTLDKQNPDRAKYIWPTVRGDVLSEWLPHCLRYVRSAYSLLIGLDLPGEALDSLAKLVFDLRLYCLTTALKHAADQVKSLQTKENWNLAFDVKYGGTTELPGQFENLVCEAVTLVKETVVQPGTREQPLLDSPVVQKELSSLMQTILLNYVQALEGLVSSMDDGDQSSAVSQLIGSPSQYRDHHHSGMVWEQRLLATLSNCRYSAAVVLPRLSELLARHGYPPLEEPLSSARLQLEALERRIIDTYLEHKSDPLVGTIEPSMYLGRWDWDTNHTPTDLRPYVKEVIANLIAVHAEVNRLCPELVIRVLSQITETVAEELSRLMSCVTKFSSAGSQQARIDITALQRCLKPFTQHRAQVYFDEAMEAVPVLKVEDQKFVDEILTKCESRMRLQLCCFHGSSALSVS